MKRMTVFSLLIVAALVLGACSQAAKPTATTAPTMAPKPTPTSAPTATPEPTEAPMPKDIVDIAVADGRFTTLVAAVQAAGLVDTLKGAGPFTVFAPTDDAFAKLPAGTVETLLKPENLEQLKSILLYHVVAGKVMAADVVKLTTADTVLGKPVTIKVDMGNVYINDAKVILTDIETSNGVIHVIDTVHLAPG